MATIVKTASRKLYEDLKFKERIHIQRQMEVPLLQAMQYGSPYGEEVLYHLAYVAGRRLGRDEVTYPALDEMTDSEFITLMGEMLDELGFETEEIEVDDDGVPLVNQESATKSESSEQTSETQNSLTSTTNASSQDGS